MLDDPVSQVAPIAFVNGDVAAERKRVIAKAIDRFVITFAGFIIMYEPVRTVMRQLSICIALVIGPSLIQQNPVVPVGHHALFNHRN